ncbi:AorFlbE [Aspergillus homomorphus CBS 101889]|uniref:AorFlbE n=1 Tax=Aspergillus homomorphus (strain CBS 101889) TaxID=1450537 RepID=A0A395IA74_ASPHC|nr:AorFlbE [Aspergillus homomorphus CBS 101889]RAL17067.1 AorFlbE [Aspergillus homomorphus CBS 101889]
MPVYMLYGFRWPRAGFTGIRVYIVLHNLEDATAEYIQQPVATELLLESFQKTDSSIVERLPDLRFIEQYDPEDTSDAAVSKPFAYVAAKVISIPEAGVPCSETSWTPEDLFNKSPLEPAAEEAITEMRDKYAAGERIGWYIIYNGDPERWFPPSDDEEDSMDDEAGSYVEGEEYDSDQTPPATPSSATVRLPERLTRFFGRKTA